MSQLLTVTRIPEEKFRRFSRFPYVAATEIDERYNNVYVKSQGVKANEKSNLKFLESSIPNNRRREVTFDFKEMPDKSDRILDTVPRVSPALHGQVILHHVDITDRNEDVADDGKENSEGNDYAKLKEKFLADSREEERKFVKSKEAELYKGQYGNSDWCHISYELPKVPDSLEEKRNNSAFGNDYFVSKQKKQQNPVDGSDREDVMNDADRKEPERNSGETKVKVNGNRYGDHAMLELIDFGYSLPNSYDKILNAVKKPFGLLKNTRFGGDTKVTAYRPSTTMDRFRKEKLEAIKEIQADGLDIDEGKKIWAEMNTIINKSTNRRKRMNQQLDKINCHTNTTFIPRVAMDTDQKTDRNMDLKYAVELRPLCRRRNDDDVSMSKDRIWSDEREMVKGIKHVENKSDEIANTVEKVVNDGESHGQFRRFKHEYFFTEKDLKGSDNHRFEENEKSDTSLNGNLNHTDEMNDYFMNNLCNIQNENKKMIAGGRQLSYPGLSLSCSGPVIHLPADGACNNKVVTMATTLPRIASSRTPLPTGITQPPPRSHSSASMYVPYPPKELSSSTDFLRVPGRINPLAPPPPRRRINWTWETTDQHYENEKRSLLMQKREHTRYHSAWSKAFYGGPAEKESYRRHFREVLKQQMSDKSKMEKVEFKEKIKETEQAISYDRDCRMNDATEYHRKHAYLMQYRDVNKQQMEDRWANTKYSRELENRIDRERLRYNPINWSCSLK